jgi:phosphoribosylformylglycinamidine synthase PurS subunit
MRARVTVTLKTGILDPQGKAIEGALRSLGVEGVASVRQGKVFDIELDADGSAEAETVLRQAAEKLLANTVIENFHVAVDETASGARPEAVTSATEDEFAPDTPVPAEEV